MTVEVVALRCDETQGDLFRLSFNETQSKGFAYRQEIAAVVQRTAKTGAGLVVEQAGVGRKHE